MIRTVKVRVAVVMDTRGEWYAVGWSSPKLRCGDPRAAVGIARSVVGGFGSTLRWNLGRPPHPRAGRGRGDGGGAG